LLRRGLRLQSRSTAKGPLERSGWNQTRAAALLGVNRDQIRYRIEKFKLERVPLNQENFPSLRLFPETGAPVAPITGTCACLS